MSSPSLYIFLDEGGNLDFSPSGTKYFTITGVAAVRPFPLDGSLSSLRFDLIEQGLNLQCFHATEDKQHVRDRVFALIGNHLQDIRADSVIVEKPKTGPSLREPSRFYPKMLAYLLQYVMAYINYPIIIEVIVITDRIPINKKRQAVEKAIKQVLADTLPAHASYRVVHHESKSCAMLQVADYVNWAIFRKWEQGDVRSWELVKDAIKSEFDIFKKGTTHWYKK